ncbi:MAG: ribonuclease D, partial [Planctomycetes bacterium]|nr:ribonuclease D [Planctomycetota bacterium]
MEAPTRPFILVKDGERLNSLLCEIADAKIVALDTEFTRRKTYFPILSLLQLCCGKEAYLIDAQSLDIAPLLEFLRKPELLKIFHAGQQDMEIISDFGTQRLSGIRDTQVAAMFCGYKHQIGLEDITRELLGIDLQKEETVSDWSARP